MKSRFFSTNEVFVDVSEIVAVRLTTHMQWVVFRNGNELNLASIADAKAIQQAVLDYEAAMQEQWESPILSAPLVGDLDFSPPAKIVKTGAKKPSWQQEEIDRINQAQDGGTAG